MIQAFHSDKRIHKHTTHKSRSDRRGSSLLLVIMAIAIMSVLMSAYMKMSVHQQKANKRQEIRLEAKRASESLANYAAAQLVNNLQIRATFSALKANTNMKLAIPDSISASISSKQLDPTSFEVIIATAPTDYSWTYIDPAHPEKADDPLKGKIVRVKEIEIYAKATGISPSHSSIKSTQVSRLVLQVRDDSLLSYAIFYNGDLELTPETDTEVDGPVHANGNLYVSATTGMSFSDTVTASGNFLHGLKALNGAKWDQQLADITFKVNGIDVELKRDPASSGTLVTDWIDSNAGTPTDELNTNWLADSTNAFNGNLQDSAHGIEARNAVGFEPYTDGLNYSYAMIEPVDSENNNPYYKGETVRYQKLAYRAGLTLEVTGSPRSGSQPYDSETGEPLAEFTENSYSVRAYRYKRDAFGNPEINAVSGLPIKEYVNLPAGLVGNANGAMTEIEVDADVEGYANRVEVVETLVPAHVTELQTFTRDVTPIRGDSTDNLVDHDAIYDARIEELEALVVSYPHIFSKSTTGSGTTYTRTWEKEMTVYENGLPKPLIIDGVQQYKNASETYEYVREGFVDHREEKKMDALYLDIGRLSELINTDPSDWGSNYDINSPGNAFDPDTDWNGVVYIETPVTEDFSRLPVESSSGVTQPGDQIKKARDPNLAVVLINGDRLPSHNKSDGYAEGFSLVTNTPLYVIGNYNADGDMTTGTATQNEAGEVPALLAADTITILSREFADPAELPERPINLESATPAETAQYILDLKEANKNLGRRQSIAPTNDRWTSNAYATTDTEVATALIGGFSPTKNMNEQSGGAHNFIRFLQDWNPNNNATELRYRGSIVALYETEVHTATIPSNYEHIYSPPARTFGHSQFFKDGHYPPGLSPVRSYRKTSLTFTSTEEFEEAANLIPPPSS